MRDASRSLHRLAFYWLDYAWGFGVWYVSRLGIVGLRYLYRNAGHRRCNHDATVDPTRNIP
jgi:hypothetical protein